MRTFRKSLIVAVLFQSFVFRADGQIILSLLFGDKLNSESLSFGIHLDYSWNQFTGIEKEKPLKNLNLGLFFTYHINERWHANLEMLAKYKRGADKLPPYDLGNDTLNGLFVDGSFSREIHYLSLPITIQYLLPAGIYAEIGPQFSFRTKAKDVFSADLPEGKLELEKDIRADINRWDMGWLAGVGYRIQRSNGISIGLRYQAGFSDVAKTWNGKQQHRQWGIYANIPIGGTKKSGKSPE
jgi:long-subunit fatty acid transport protein